MNEYNTQYYTTYVINPGACKNGTMAHVPSNVATPLSITNELFDLPPITGSMIWYEEFDLIWFVYLVCVCSEDNTVWFPKEYKWMDG